MVLLLYSTCGRTTCFRAPPHQARSSVVKAVFGFDVGTSSKGVLTTLDGRLLGTPSAPRRVAPSGHFRWTRMPAGGVLFGRTGCSPRNRTPRVAVGVSGMGPQALADADHRLVSQRSCTVDTRSVAEIEERTDRLGGSTPYHSLRSTLPARLRVRRWPGCRSTSWTCGARDRFFMPAAGWRGT